MPEKRRRNRVHSARTPVRNPEILDVHKAAGLLTVSVDTVYDLFKSGELPARKVGRKWITTKAVVTRWIEGSVANEAADRAIDAGDKAGLTRMLQSSPVRLRTAAG
jgi:excisionase family DNA binding protein